MTEPLVTADRELLAVETERHVLALRELLVRHDENLKAWHLMESVPYWIAERPLIVKATREQRAMVAHALDPDEYRTYYADNPHERPFEEQYGISVAEADKYLPRVAFLCDGIAGQSIDLGRQPRILDLTGNDGWMAANLSIAGYECDMCELNVGAVARAKERKKEYPGMGSVFHRDFRDKAVNAYDAVVLFETVEHLADPIEGLRHAAYNCRDEGLLYVSTPDGAVEDGNLPTWDVVERKGHLWAWPADQFRAMLEQIGEVVRFEVGPDRVAVAEVRPG